MRCPETLPSCLGPTAVTVAAATAVVVAAAAAAAGWPIMGPVFYAAAAGGAVDEFLVSYYSFCSWSKSVCF